MESLQFPRILVAGGAGYVGSALVPALLDLGYRVRVADTFWYGDDIYGSYGSNPNLENVPCDLRDSSIHGKLMEGIDAVIHLACISNDPSFELNPNLGKSINFDCFEPLVQSAIGAGVKRFIYASSSSIYGVKETPDVREEAEPLPLTDYSRFKLDCEKVLLGLKVPEWFERVIIRPATVCGYAKRLRLDLSVNILTIHALVNHKIRIFGGKQLRPNLNIKDMVRAYQVFLQAPGAKIDCEAFNVGFQNLSIESIAFKVKEVIGDPTIELEYTPSDDNRSYHVNSDKVKRVLGFEAKFGVEDAVQSIVDAYRAGKIPEPFKNTLYSNIKRMQELNVR
jgi:nucleoside-diphosphate-sugar epimerase